MDKKQPTRFRQGPEAPELPRWLSWLYGVSQTAVLEMTIRETARRERSEASTGQPRFWQTPSRD